MPVPIVFLASFGEGTQRTYAYHLVDHLRWLAASRSAEETVTIEDLRRYLALCGAEHAGPLGVPWRERPLGEAALAVRATCLKGYYLDLTMREDVNPSLRAALSARRLANHRDRDRSALGASGDVGRVEPVDPWRAAEEASAAAPGRGSRSDARRGPDGA